MGEGWSINSGWLQGDPCERPFWWGVTCDYYTGAVTGLDLSFNNLIGVPPIELSLIGSLQSYNLSGNMIGADGGLQDLAYLKNLTAIDLSYNSISSTLPTGLGRLEKLEVLNLSNNSIHGTFPLQYIGLFELQTLDLSSNSIEGSLMSNFGRLQQLSELRIRDNLITGTIPYSLGDIKWLEILDLSYNWISGTLPTSFGQLSALQLLDLSTNIIEGSLPWYFCESAELSFFSISDNSITGTLPQMWKDARKEETIVDLSFNMLIGTLSSYQIDQFEQLLIILIENDIEGIDPKLCSKSAWMNGYVGMYGCDAIMCPSGTYNKQGRHTPSSGPCIPCSSSMYFGKTECITNTDILPEDIGINILYYKSDPEENLGFMNAVSDITGGRVDYFDGYSYNPLDLNSLLEYDCVMVHTRNSFNDLDALNKILVEYVESGRSVVISDGFMDKVRGDFVGLGYSPIESVGVVGELSDCIQYLGDGNTLLYSGIGPRSGFCATVNNRDENLTITHDAVPDGSYSDGTPAAVYSPEFRVVYLNGAYCWGSAFPSVNCPGGDQPRRWANACLASRV